MHRKLIAVSLAAALGLPMRAQARPVAFTATLTNNGRDGARFNDENRNSRARIHTPWFRAR